MTARTVPRILSALTRAYCIAVAALLLHLGNPALAAWWPHALVFAAWAMLPALLPWLIANAWTSGVVAVGMTGFALVSSGYAAVAYGHAFFVSQSSTAALALLFVPLWQLVALIPTTIGVGIVALLRQG